MSESLATRGYTFDLVGGSGTLTLGGGAPSPFSVAYAVAIDANTVRVVLTAVPNSFVPANFSIPTTTVVSAVPDPNDPFSVILSLVPGLQPNNYAVTCSGLTSGAPPAVMTAPLSAAFAVLVGPSATTNPTALSTLRQHIPPSMVGDVWTQLLASLGDEEQFAWDQSAAVYDQLFLVSAEGKYLDARASEEGGYLRPTMVGFTDDVFRDLVIQLSTRKLTLNAFLRVLEIYYGLDAVRAHVRTNTPQAFNIPDGSQQVFNIDGVGPLAVTFHGVDFTNPAAATAIEAAIALNRGFGQGGIKALALPYVDIQTGLTYLTVYSASRGLRGSIESVSGPLPFPAGKRTVQSQPHSAYVKVVGGVVEIILPATSIVVSRIPTSTAAYLSDISVGAISSASQTNGVLTLNTVAGHLLTTGGQVFLDGLLAIPGSTNRCCPNGFFRVNSTPSPTQFTVLVESIPATGTQSFNVASASFEGAKITAVGEGPYMHDPTDSTAITEIHTTLSQALEAGHQYPAITVASTASFPDQRGYVVFGFGFEYQVGPVPYLGVSGGTLLLDPAFVIPTAVPSGASVNLASRLSDDLMPHGDGDFWLTPSPSGRVAAENDIDSIAAGGRELTKTVVYPGDIGLGGAGLLTHGVPRLTDAVAVWGSDNLDTEIATARVS